MNQLRRSAGQHEIPQDFQSSKVILAGFTKYVNIELETAVH
jgi:hypothetical protein